MAGMFDRLMGKGSPAPEDSQRIEILVQLWARRTGMPPEKIRAVIADLQKKGVPITNTNIGDALMSE